MFPILFSEIPSTFKTGFSVGEAVSFPLSESKIMRRKVEPAFLSRLLSFQAESRNLSIFFSFRLRAPDRAIWACFGLLGPGKVTAMSGFGASPMLEGRRIKPEKPVLKGGIFPPNYRLDDSTPFEP